MRWPWTQAGPTEVCARPSIGLVVLGLVVLGLVTPPSERVGWTFQTVQGPRGGGPYTNWGGVLQSYKVTLV